MSPATTPAALPVGQSPVVAVSPTPTLVVSTLAGLCAAGTAVVVFRSLRTAGSRSQDDLARPFLAVAALLAGTVAAHPFVARALPANVISIVPLMAFLVLFVPWNVFAFRYAGRGHLLTRRRTAALAVPIALLAVVYAAVAVGVLRPSRDVYSSVLLGASTLLLGLVALTFVSGGLVLLAAYRHENVPLASGAAVVFPVAVLVVGIQVVSLSAFLTRDLLAALHLLAAAAALPLGVVRYDVLAARPGTTTLGERTVVEDFNEAVLVVGADGRVIRSNRRAERLFGDDIGGRDFEDVTGTAVAELRAADTHEQWTAEGYKQFDPRVSTIESGGDRPLGRTVTLIDVTDREILEQRIQVLNRILRHNIQNSLDVINAHAEVAIHDEWGDELLDGILDVTDDIERMSAKARRIEKLTRTASEDRSGAELAPLVTAVIEEASRDRPEVTASVEVPELTLDLDGELLRFGLRNVVENAIEHNDGPGPSVEVRGEETGSGVQLVVADDGPGIPEAERRVIEAGREEATDHATSLGLWGTKWAIQTLGGELSLRDSDLGGTAVVIDLPAAATAAETRPTGAGPE